MIIICILKAASKPTQLYFKWHFRTILNKEHNIFNEHAISNKVDSVVHTQIPFKPEELSHHLIHTHTHKWESSSEATLHWGKLPQPRLYLCPQRNPVFNYWSI